jgi:type IV pilus assembly protein PilE
LVTVVIISILAAIAIPSYRQYVIRSNRSAAKSAMLDLANREQHLLVATRAYADTAALLASGYVLPQDVSQNYTWSVALTGPPVPTFLITFTPTGGQAEDGALTLDSEGRRAPAEKWQR